jgi:hypothetical protein
MLQPEMDHLMEVGFLDADRILYTPPGLHAIPDELETRLVRRLREAKQHHPPDRIIVAYGRKCYLSTGDPTRKLDVILEEQGPGISRVQGDYGYDILASIEERESISGGEADKVLWFTPAWLRNWKTVYQRHLGWDRADANANFPGYYKKIVVLDGLSMTDDYVDKYPERILELFDWTAIAVEFEKISLERLKEHLLECLV